MKTLHTVTVGEWTIVLRSDGGVYLGQVGDFGYMGRATRLGSSAAICEALAAGLTEMGQHIRVPKDGAA